MFVAAYFPFFLFLLTLFSPGGAPEAKKELRKTAYPLPAVSENVRLIRVLVLKNVREIVVESSPPYRLIDAEGRRLLAGASLGSTQVKPYEKGIMFGSHRFPTDALYLIPEGEGFKAAQKNYRGTFGVLRQSDGTLNGVNELDLDDYLKGVLPKESPANWSAETLKAQAVASRTYALFYAIEKQAEPYTVTGDVLSQVYGGRDAEDPRTNQAVDSTRGDILSFQGNVFPAYFHSTCGGATAAAHEVWPVERHPVLLGSRCAFCQGSKHYQWTERFSRKEIEEKLKARGFRVGSVEKISLLNPDPYGRYTMIQVQHSGGKLKIPSPDFRMALDPFRFKSTLIKSVLPQEGFFVFQGLGWGHGVGFCQYGAKRLGELGYSYDRILQYYYPGSKVVRYY